MGLENKVQAIVVKEAVKIEASETLEEKLHNDFEIKLGSEINTPTNTYKKDDEIYKLLKEYRKKVSTEENLKIIIKS